MSVSWTWDLCASHSLPLTNTLFKHQSVHKCTWHDQVVGEDAPVSTRPNMSWGCAGSTRLRQSQSGSHNCSEVQPPGGEWEGWMYWMTWGLSLGDFWIILHAVSRIFTVNLMFCVVSVSGLLCSLSALSNLVKWNRNPALFAAMWNRKPHPDQSSNALQHVWWKQAPS